MRAQRARETIESYEREGASMDFAVSTDELAKHEAHIRVESVGRGHVRSCVGTGAGQLQVRLSDEDRKSTRLNSSHQIISYAVFCLKKKKKKINSPYV